jgi:hypothetical protein
MTKEQEKQLKELRVRDNALISTYIEIDKLSKLFPNDNNIMNMMKIISYYRSEINKAIKELEEKEKE